MLRKPNLFVVDAMKSGTTSVIQYLGAHPDIFMTPVKEPMHFSREESWSHENEPYLISSYLLKPIQKFMWEKRKH